MQNALNRLDYTTTQFSNVTLTRRRNDPFHEDRLTYFIDTYWRVFQMQRYRQGFPTEIEWNICGA